jgi:NTE family protein
MKVNITNLVFEGGGVLGNAYIGAIEQLETQGIMKNVKNYAGSSVGALFATLMACGATVKFLQDEFNTIDFASLKDSSWGISRDLWRLYTKYGYYKGDKLLKLCEKYVRELTGSAQCTFLELYQKQGTYLIITGTNLNTQSTVFFSYKTYPDMPIVFALRLSCSYPYFFKAVEFEGDVYVDGGLLMNLPIRAFDNDFLPEQTLGLKLIDNSDLKIWHNINDFKRFTECIINSVYNQSQRLYFSESDWERTVKINVGNYTTLDFSITTKDKEWLKEQGKKAVQEFEYIQT